MEKESLQILLAEDNMANQKLTEKMLTLLGVNVSLADNGEEAVIFSGTNKFDIILMDMQMPILDGVEATKMIRQNPDNPNHKTRIVALTANAFQDDKEKCLSAGMDDFITKPVSRQTLQNIIESLNHSKTSNNSIQLNNFVKFNILEDVDKDDRKVIIRETLSDLPSRLASIKDCIDNKDLTGLSEYCHKLKGIFLMYDAKNILETLDSIRSLYKNGIKDGYQPLYHKLIKQSEEFTIIVQDYLYKLQNLV